MAHFAKLGVGNIVERVEVVKNEVAPTEQAGQDFLNSIYGTNDVWKKTSYNTYGGQHKLGGTPFRLNYAGKGFIYLDDLDGFVEPQPYPSWTLNTTTGLYDPPVARPNNGQPHRWNEETQSWEEYT